MPPAAPFVHAIGSDLRCEVERATDPLAIDHVWITMRIGDGRSVVISVNTRSLINERAGFDGRVRRATLRGSWETLPARGLATCAGFDYAALEERANLYYEPCERIELEAFLDRTITRACLLEVWGTAYASPTFGIHQIHSRRASCAAPRDVIGQDGALQFYFGSERTSLLVLFKFCGQP